MGCIKYIYSLFVVKKQQTTTDRIIMSFVDICEIQKPLNLCQKFVVCASPLVYDYV